MASRSVNVMICPCDTVRYCDSRIGELLCNLPYGHLEPHRDGEARWLDSGLILTY